MRGDGIDQAVATCFLEAIQPAQLAVSLSTLDQLEARARQIDRQWHLRLERGQYEADLARHSSRGSRSRQSPGGSQPGTGLE